MGKAIIINGGNFFINRVKKTTIIDYDPVVKNYLESLSTELDTALSMKLQNLVASLKRDNLWDKVLSFYPILGGSVQDAFVELKNPSINRMYVNSDGDINKISYSNGYLSTSDSNTSGVYIPKEAFVDTKATLCMGTNGNMGQYNMYTSFPSVMNGSKENSQFWGSVLYDSSTEKFYITFRKNMETIVANSSEFSMSYNPINRIVSVCSYTGACSINNISDTLNLTFELPSAINLEDGASIMGYKLQHSGSRLYNIASPCFVAILKETTGTEQLMFHELFNAFADIY